MLVKPRPRAALHSSSLRMKCRDCPSESCLVFAVFSLRLCRTSLTEGTTGDNGHGKSNGAHRNRPNQPSRPPSSLGGGRCALITMIIVSLAGSPLSSPSRGPEPHMPCDVMATGSEHGLLCDHRAAGGLWAQGTPWAEEPLLVDWVGWLILSVRGHGCSSIGVRPNKTGDGGEVNSQFFFSFLGLIRILTGSHQSAS